MKKIWSMLLAVALLFSSLPLLPQPAAAEEPLFTISGLENGSMISQVAAAAPENAPYTISVLDIVHSDSTATTAEETFKAGERYEIMLMGKAKGEEPIDGYFTSAKVEQAIASIADLNSSFVMPKEGGFKISFLFEPDMQENDAGDLSIWSPETIQPEVGTPLLATDTIAQRISLDNETGLSSVSAYWYNENEDASCPAGYVPENNDRLTLQIFLRWKNGYDYGFTPEMLTNEKLRSLMGDSPKLTKTTVTNSGRSSEKRTIIMFYYDLFKPEKKDATLTLEGEGLVATPASGYKVGDRVVLTLNAPQGKTLSALLINGKDVSKELKDNQYSFDLVDKNTAVAVWKDPSATPVMPDKPATSTVLTIGSKTLIRTVNGVAGTTMMDVAPYINPGQNRTMLPLRAVGEILGLKVEWSDATRTVSVTGEGVNATVPVDGKVIIVNGKTITVDASAEIKNGRTMMSIANLGTALGLERDKNIIWDAATRTVTINV